ncbi:hypothetical protein E4V51_07765 [Paenibacillus sp. 28ISP30-2]|nr:hypothetical protein [Paenibacillus sp. 28ISP30-2]
MQPLKKLFDLLLTIQMSLEGTNDIILDLCTIFEDEVTEPAANNYLIETIFYIAKRNDLEAGLYNLALGTPKMLPHAEFWAENPPDTFKFKRFSNFLR